MQIWRTSARAVIGVLLAAARAFIFIRGSIRAYWRDSALERPGVIQAYVETGNHAVVIGIAVVAYIGTRAGDID